jgi:hypothetical protein
MWDPLFHKLYRMSLEPVWTPLAFDQPSNLALAALMKENFIIGRSRHTTGIILNNVGDPRRNAQSTVQDTRA